MISSRASASTRSPFGRHGPRVLRRQRPSSRSSSFSTLQDLLPRLRLAAGTSAAGRPLRAGPSPPSRPSPGPGSTSTKLTCISGRMRAVNRARRGEVAALGGLDHLHHLRRNLVRRHRDDAAAADRHQRQRHRIVAREHDEVGGTARQTSHICVMLPEASLTPTMFGIAASRASVDGSTLHAGAARHVVDDDRQRRALGDGAVVLDTALPASACCSTA